MRADGAPGLTRLVKCNTTRSDTRRRRVVGSGPVGVGGNLSAPEAQAEEPQRSDCKMPGPCVPTCSQSPNRYQ